MEFVSRAEARGRGLPSYFTGKPCKWGHVAKRVTASGACMACNNKHHAKNRDSRLAKMRQYYRENMGMVRESKRINHQRNPWVQKSITAARRASLRQRIPAWFGELDDFVMKEAAGLCARREASIGGAWHIDHMIPLQAAEASGLHCATNIQVIPAAMNYAKNNRMILTEPGEWVSMLS